MMWGMGTHRACCSKKTQRDIKGTAASRRLIAQTTTHTALILAGDKCGLKLGNQCKVQYRERMVMKKVAASRQFRTSTPAS